MDVKSEVPVGRRSPERGVVSEMDVEMEEGRRGRDYRTDGEEEAVKAPNLLLYTIIPFC